MADGSSLRAAMVPRSYDRTLVPLPSCEGTCGGHFASAPASPGAAFALLPACAPVTAKCRVATAASGALAGVARRTRVPVFAPTSIGAFARLTAEAGVHACACSQPGICTARTSCAAVSTAATTAAPVLPSVSCSQSWPATISVGRGGGRASVAQWLSPRRKSNAGALASGSPTAGICPALLVWAAPGSSMCTQLSSCAAEDVPG